MRTRRPGTSLLTLMVLMFVAACGDGEPLPRETVLTGEAMGTTWRVMVAGEGRPDLESPIAARLEDIEGKMSHWREDSEVSRFNRAAVGEVVPVSEETVWVVSFAEQMRERTGGAFDVRVAGAVAARGFGPAGLKRDPVSPSAGEIRVSDDPPSLTKNASGLAIDLSGIAKGYAVDLVGALLDERGIRNYLVELGGELKARGEKSPGKPWAVGIEIPDPASRRVHARVSLDNESIATSGNYRLFREREDGSIESHLVDPRGGGRRDEWFRAVSVMHPEAMTADAWATALFVMGEEDGFAFAEREGLAACFLNSGKNEVMERTTTRFNERAAAEYDSQNLR